jgi:hypothetical protein
MLIIVVWIFLSGAVVLMNKLIFSAWNFPFPVFLSACHMLFCSLLIRAFGMCGIVHVVEKEKGHKHFSVNTIAVGVLFACSVFLSNSAYMYLSVVHIQMLKSFTVLVVYFFSCACGIDVLRMETSMRLCIISIGIIIGSYGDESFNYIGFALQLAAIGCDAFRLVLSQVLLHSNGDKKMSSVDMMYEVTPVSFVFLSLLFVVLELKHMLLLGINLPVSVLTFNCVLVFALNLTAYIVVEKTSALTINLVAVLKDIGILAFAPLLFKTTISLYQLFGYLTALAGVVIYNAYDRKDTRRNQETNDDYELVNKEADDTSGDAQVVIEPFPTAIKKTNNAENRTLGLAFFGALLFCAYFSLVPTVQPSDRLGHVILSTMRGEADFVVEWLNYHRWIGFDRVVIYDQNDNKTIMPLLLREYVNDGNVTIVPWKVGDQPGSYHHGLVTYGLFAKSITFLDGDEFLVLCKHGSVDEAFTKLLPSEDTCLELSWLPFTFSQDPDKPPPGVGVLEKLTLRSTTTYTEHAGKTVLKAGRSFYYTKVYGKPLKLPLWHKCYGRKDFKRPPMVDHNVIRINHYRFRYGLQSFKKRVERGFAGNFKGASSYAKLNISKGDPWIQNVTQDFAMVKTKQKLKGLMTAVPSSEKKKTPSYCSPVSGHSVPT